jgi:TonB family protein
MKPFVAGATLLLAACATQTQQILNTQSHESGNCQIPTPPFPATMRNDRTFTSAKVTVRFELLPSGAIGRVIVKESSGYSVFDSAAVEAVRRSQCQYDPPILEPRWLETSIKFELR